MITYDIAALLKRFDTFEFGQGGVTGRLSSLVGEELLLDVLAHALADGGPVELLPERPRRDDQAFKDAPSDVAVPKVRDLDFWLQLRYRELMVVECKQWTASSAYGGGSVPEDPAGIAEYARRRWEELDVPEWWSNKWDDTTKIALPLRPPAGRTAEDVRKARRVLAVWRPISSNGGSPFSQLSSQTLSGGEWVDVPIEVFSASLYLRQLLADGVRTLTPVFDGAQTLFDAVNALFHREPDAPDS